MADEDCLRELAVVLRKDAARAVRFDEFHKADALEGVADAITKVLRTTAKRRE